MTQSKYLSMQNSLVFSNDTPKEYTGNCFLHCTIESTTQGLSRRTFLQCNLTWHHLYKYIDREETYFDKACRSWQQTSFFGLGVLYVECQYIWRQIVIFCLRLLAQLAEPTFCSQWPVQMSQPHPLHIACVFYRWPNLVSSKVIKIPMLYARHWSYTPKNPIKMWVNALVVFQCPFNVFATCQWFKCTFSHQVSALFWSANNHISV